MNSQVFSVLLVIILAAVVPQFDCLPNTKLQQSKNQKFDINAEGYFVLKYYARQERYFQNAVAVDGYSQRSLYKLVSEGPLGHFHVEMETTSATKYFGINATDFELILVPFASRAIFSPVAASDPSKVNFYTNFTGINEPLVTPDSDSPTPFYLQRRYPGEARASFSTVQFPVEDSYNGTRSQILRTIDRISNGDMGDRNASYATLLSLMESYGQMNRTEAFAVGEYIRRDLGLGVTFYTLPRQVQLLTSVGLSLNYRNYMNSGEYRMKYVTASSNHVDFYPYTFTYSNTTLNKWAITYSSSSGIHQLYISGQSLMDKVSDVKEFVFQLELATSKEDFKISHNFYLVTLQRSSPYGFLDYPTMGSYVQADFFVDNYTPNLNNA